MKVLETLYNVQIKPGKEKREKLKRSRNEGIFEDIQKIREIFN